VQEIGSTRVMEEHQRVDESTFNHELMYMIIPVEFSLLKVTIS